MKTNKDLWEMAFDEWYYQTDLVYTIYISGVEFHISGVEKTGSNMAYMAAKMILEGRF